MEIASLVARIIKPLFVIRTLCGGGAERVLLTVLRNLDKELFKPTLFLMQQEGVYWDQIPDHLRVVCALDSGTFREAPFRVLKKLINEARSHDVVVGALEGTPTYLAWLGATLARKPVAGWVHIDLRECLSRARWWHRPSTRLVYRRLRNVAFVSAGAMESAAKLIGRWHQSGWRVIYDPLDWASYAGGGGLGDGTVERSHSEEPTVISMGRLEEQKGFDVLLRVHARLLRTGLRHRLLILGEGTQRPELEALIEELGIRETVSLPGFVSDPLPYLISSDLFVLSSRFEGFSMAILESLAVGLPVVSTDCPSGPAEILDRGRYGVLVPVGDEAALAGAIRRVLGDSGLRSRLAQSGRRRALDFAPGKVSGGWRQLLLSACAQDQGGTNGVGTNGRHEIA